MYIIFPALYINTYVYVVDPVYSTNLAAEDDK